MRAVVAIAMEVLVMHSVLLIITVVMIIVITIIIIIIIIIIFIIIIIIIIVIIVIHTVDTCSPIRNMLMCMIVFTTMFVSKPAFFVPCCSCACHHGNGYYNTYVVFVCGVAHSLVFFRAMLLLLMMAVKIQSDESRNKWHAKVLPVNTNTNNRIQEKKLAEELLSTPYRTTRYDDRNFFIQRKKENRQKKEKIHPWEMGVPFLHVHLFMP